MNTTQITGFYKLTLGLYMLLFSHPLKRSFCLENSSLSLLTRDMTIDQAENTIYVFL